MLFRDKYWFLSNMFPCSVTLEFDEGIYTFTCAEAAFQACMNPSNAKEFVGIDGFEAKRMGEGLYGRENNSDDESKDECMELVVKAKFEQNPILMKKLLKVKGEIIDENRWKEGYWGMYKKLDHVEEQTKEPVYVLCGENKLGKILMRIRSSESDGINKEPV